MNDGSVPLIVLDECHKAKNLLDPKTGIPTITGKAVHYLQQRVPNAAVLYSSATGAPLLCFRLSFFASFCFFALPYEGLPSACERCVSPLCVQ